MWKAIFALMEKDFRIEWRQRYSLNGLLLYLASSIFLIYLSFEELQPVTWITLYWLVILFTAVTAVSRSFLQEGRARWLYYYTIAHPREVIISKLIYNSLLILLLAWIGLLLHSLFNQNPVSQPVLFFVTASIGSVSLAFTFTILSAIAAKATSNTTLMSIMSLPLIIPLFLLIIHLSKTSLLNHIENFPWNDISLIAGLDVLMIALSLILFPYLWRD